MIKFNQILTAILTLALVIGSPSTLYAASGTYVCSIKDTLRLSDTGQFVTHGWAANYMNRKFTVDRESGKVIGTTALKERLINWDATHKPLLLNKDNPNTPFAALTHYDETGQYSLLQINEHDEFDNVNEKPFFYPTYVGMVLTGTCVVDEPRD